MKRICKNCRFRVHGEAINFCRKKDYNFIGNQILTLSCECFEPVIEDSGHCLIMQDIKYLDTLKQQNFFEVCQECEYYSRPKGFRDNFICKQKTPLDRVISVTFLEPKCIFHVIKSNNIDENIKNIVTKLLNENKKNKAKIAKITDILL